MELVEGIAPDRVALTPRPAEMSPIPRESASAVDIQDENLEETL